MVRIGLAALLLSGLSAGAGAQTAGAADQPLYVVVHIDVAPTPAAQSAAANGAADGLAATNTIRAEATAQAVELLRQWAANCHKEPGCERFDVLQQTDRPNHFSLLETWRDRAAFEIHEASAASRAIRGKLQPILASPFDERLHSLVP